MPLRAASRACGGSSRTGCFGCGTPSMIQSALKILCRQCSEFACANIISSTSVGSRPRRRKLVDEVVDLVGREREAQLGVGRRDAPRGRRASSGIVVSGRGASARTALRAPSRSSSTASVIRSCSSGSSAARSAAASGAPSRVGDPVRRRRARCASTAARPQLLRDVGGLRRPRRDRARARHDEQQVAGLVRRLVVRPVGEDALERRSLGGGERAVDFDEVPVGGADRRRPA